MSTVQVALREITERHFAVRHHDGAIDTIEATRRPLYQHLIMHELVGGPPVLRFGADGGIDVMVGIIHEFEGDDEITVEVLPTDWYAVGHYEGPAAELPAAREAFIASVSSEGYQPHGDILQMHLMDEIEGATEQEFQVRVRGPNP